MPRSIAVALAALLLMLVAGPASAQAKKRVAFVGPGDSIQAAVDAARPGDTILVKGVHRENVAITTNGISLRGLGAVLRPPATPAKNACFDPSSPDTSGVNGICVIGDGDFVTGEVNREVRNVTVSGFRVRGFGASGIFAFAARNTTFARNVTRDNEEYGLVAFSSTGTRFLFNRASGSGEAGIYVGDSPKANALLLGNEVSDNLFGVFIRNALGGKARAQRGPRQLPRSAGPRRRPRPRGRLPLHGEPRQQQHQGVPGERGDVGPDLGNRLRALGHDGRAASSATGSPATSPRASRCSAAESSSSRATGARRRPTTASAEI